MAANIDSIKARLKSVKSTMQITRAMELVATSKLRQAKEKALRSRPFEAALRESIDVICACPELYGSVYLDNPKDDSTLYIVIAGDRGLAGGYNSGVFRLARSLIDSGGQARILPIGKKAAEHYRRSSDIYYSLENAAATSVGDALTIAERLCSDFKDGKFGKVVLIYTEFASMISQRPTYRTLLPLERKEGSSNSSDVILDGEPEQMLEKIIPHYVGGLISSAISESLASESAARRTAMNSANKNAAEMIDSLMLSYNRARQAVITREITEIVAAGEALQ